MVNSQFKKAFNKKISELPLKRKSSLKKEFFPLTLRAEISSEMSIRKSVSTFFITIDGLLNRLYATIEKPCFHLRAVETIFLKIHFIVARLANISSHTKIISLSFPFMV